jgi:Ca2+/Na+ antiporter
MPLALFPDPRALAYLAAGLLGLLASVLVTSRGLVTEGEAAPTRRAIAHWLPIATAAIMAAWFGHVEIAMGIAFGSSVAVLSSVTGFVVLAGPLDQMPPAVRRVWPFLTVTALLVFLLGFRGSFSPVDALLLLVQGFLCLMIWGSWRENLEVEQPTASPVAIPRRAMSFFSILETIAGLLIALIAAYAAVRGAISFSESDPRFPTSVMGATLFSVVLALPMVTTGVPAATHGRAWAALSGQIGVVFLNLGLLLPTIILIAAGKALAAHAHTAATQPATMPVAPISVIYPRVAWRIDAVALVILALLFMATADRRMKLTKVIAGGLIFSYLVYLLLVMYVTHFMA